MFVQSAVLLFCTIKTTMAERDEWLFWGIFIGFVAFLAGFAMFIIGGVMA
jgi:hypothetical protein